jgi:hypothetical protein
MASSASVTDGEPYFEKDNPALHMRQSTMTAKTLFECPSMVLPALKTFVLYG